MIINQIDICDELHQNFIDYAYEANSQRAFPDARDGLKPGQRACLWEMYHKGYSSSKPHVKSAKIAGGVVGAWWPHGDVSVYDTFARMSQNWINNIPEVDWHGLNGNIIIGNAPAADRYTEARLSKATEEGMFANIKKNTVNMISNYSEDDEWPEVLPALMPRLLINGSQGIGVTIANTWVPHNLTEITEAIIQYINEGKIDTKNIYPDFPSGGTIINKNELSTIYETGKGKIVVRGKVTIEGNSILITELPYQVFVEPFIDSIKDLILKEEITSIKDVYNKTDKKRLLIEIVCDNPSITLTKLYAKTDLQKSFNPNQFALVGKTPKLLTLKDYLDIYINHNKDCLIKEFNYDLTKAQARMEIVSGLLKALEDIDNIIALIKASKSASEALTNLIAKYQFTERQAKAIIDMKLGRLANLEKIELNQEYNELVEEIQKIELILSSDTNILNIFLQRLEAFTKKFGAARRTELMQISNSTKEEKEIEFVEPEKCVVVTTEANTIKRIPATSFRTQRRGGKGVKTQEDITSEVIRTNAIDQLMIFSTAGRMYRLLVNDIPVGTNTSKGQAIKSLVPMEANEEPATMYSIYRDTKAKFVFFTTKQGIVKKTALDEYIGTKKKSGIGAISLREGDELISVTLITDEPILMITKQGYVLKFNSSDVGATGRMTTGVKGINLGKDDEVAAVLPIRDQTDSLALFTETGLGKKIELKEFLSQKRGGKGVIGYKTTVSSGPVRAAALVNDSDSLVLIGDRTSICISAAEIPSLGRTSIGNQMIKNGKVIAVSKV